MSSQDVESLHHLDTELSAAASFLSSYLPLSTSQSTSATFSATLHDLLRLRYADHWHPADPERGSAFRALVRSGSALDSHILAAAGKAGISHDDIRKALSSSEGRVWLGEQWTLWVDPGCVSLRLDASHAARDAQFVEVYGKVPESLAPQAIKLDSLPKSSLNITTTTPPFTAAALPGTSAALPGAQDPALLSPTKKQPVGSRAIQILPPPTRMGALRPSSPLPSAHVLRRMASKPQLIDSPCVIPPTPTRPPPSSADDVFSPSPASSDAAKQYDGLSLAAPSLGAPILLSRRSSSRGSSISSIGSRSSSGSLSGDEDAFSSTESLASSITSAGTHDVLTSPWNKMRSLGEVVMDGEFKYPPVPTRAHSASSIFGSGMGHHRSQSSTSSTLSTTSSPFAFPPPSPSATPFLTPRSVPSSPSKPRRRGTRGGASNHSASSSISSPVKQAGAALAFATHESTSSITSLSSVTSSKSAEPTASKQAVVEHLGGKVGILGGGILLGVASNLGDARCPLVGEAKRRGRERRRGANSNNGNMHPHHRIATTGRPVELSI